MNFAFKGLPLLVFVFSMTANATDLVRVRLEQRLQKLELTGLAIAVQGEQASYRPIAVPINRGVEISRVLIKKKWFWKVALEGRVELKSEPMLALSGNDLKTGTKPLPNHILVAENKANFDVIGVLPVEDYLVGVIASEMPLAWPIESLKAQAIAARSYTLATIDERKTKLFQVESGIQDQVFRHVAQGVDHDPLVEKAFQAVKQTAGKILLDPRTQKTLKAFYHADCGGKTSSARSVWGVGSSSVSVADSACVSNSRAQWSFSLSKEVLVRKLQSLFPSAAWAASQLVDVVPQRPEPGSRVESLKLIFEDGKESVILADKFRAAIGYAELKSTQFELEKSDPERWVFKGKGFGHGVGLCQWGSRALGLQNKSAEEILAHYYPQSKIQNKIE